MESLSETLGITDEMWETKRRFVKEEPLAKLAIRRGKTWTPEEFKRSILDRLPKERWNDTQKAWLQLILECNGIVSTHSLLMYQIITIKIT